MLKKLILYVGVLFFLSITVASQVTVFGPVKMSPPLKGMFVRNESISLAQSATGVLVVKNGNGDDLTPLVCSGNLASRVPCVLLNLEKTLQAALERPSTFEIALNSQVVLAKSEYSRRKGTYSLPVNLLKQNSLTVAMTGSPWTSVTLELKTDVVIFPPPVNQLPVAQITVTPTQGFAPVAVSASGIGSLDPDGSIINYSWDFGDGFSTIGMLANHVYMAAGTYVVTLTVTDNAGATTSNSQSVVIIQNQPPTADLKITSDSTGLIPFIAGFDASGSTDPENQHLRFDWDFGDGVTSLSGAAQTTHQYITAGTYTVTVKVTDTLGSSSHAQGQITVTQPVVPPDPKDIAPVLSTNEQAIFYDSVRFLLTGANPVQKNVDLSQLDASRVSVLRGKIFTDSGEPLGAVKVRVLNHPEFGETLSRSDGQFDLIVNGGGYVTLLYDLSGYLSSSRQIEVNYKDYFFAPDVVLAKLDSNVTRVTLGAGTVQAARSSTSSDSSGDRTPTVVIPSGRTASLVLSDGTLKPVSSLSLRITEYTTGEDGPKKMPADLPVGIAYTHAVELSADEAIAQNAKHIQFNGPVSYYVDNFLNIPIGYGVPLGSLNPDTRLWEAERDGVVLKILDIQDNVAVLDVKGLGQPATHADLQALNISQEELTQLAGLYLPGKSLWRVQVNHFSVIDTNFLQADFQGFMGYLNDAYSYGKPKVGDCNDCGSIIDVYRLSLKEKIQTSILPFDLWYSSENALPKFDDMVLRVPLSGASIPSDLISIEYEINIAGKKISGVAPPQPDQTFVYEWDGKDAYGRDYPYQAIAKVVVRYKLKRYYAVPASPNEKTWGYLAPNVTITFNEERDGTYLEKFSNVKLGVRRTGEQYGVNGWTPGILHSFNPLTKTIYFGDGESREIDDSLRTLVTVAGNGFITGMVDGMPALGSPIGVPISVAPAIDGSIYFADEQAAKILKISKDGYLSTVAGKNKWENSGDGGLAIDSSLSSVSKIAVGPDGSIYVVDNNLRIVRKISPDGIINTIAGTGTVSNGLQSDNIPATQMAFALITGVVVSKDGSVFISDGPNNIVYKIGTDGIIRRFAGVGISGYSGDDGLASQASLSYPIVGDIGPNEEVYISDYNNAVIRQVDKAGYIRAAVGVFHGNDGVASSDGTPARTAKIRNPMDVKVSKNGHIYFLENGVILKSVNSQGIIETISYRKNNPIMEPGVFYNFSSNSMFLAKDGSVVLADTRNFRVRRLGQVFIGDKPELVQIPSEDGSEIYQFSTSGRHLKTLFAKTGQPKWQFSYDSTGLLVSITDADGRSTGFQRDSLGGIAAIVNKYGQNIAVGVDVTGWLTSLQLPSGDAYQFQYSQPGLLSVFSKPNGNSSRFIFDNRNNLVSDEDSQGGIKTLVRRDLPDGYASIITYPDGTQRTAVSTTSFGSLAISEVTERDGSKRRWTQDLSMASPHVSTAFPFGGMIIQGKGSDPRLGGAASFDSYISYSLGWKNHVESREIYLDRYDPNDIFNFKQREIMNPGGSSQRSIKTHTYDSSLKEWSLVSSTGRALSGKIDSQERPVLLKSGTLEPVQISYDNFGHVSQVKQGSRISTLSYDSNGFLSSITDPLQRQHRFVNDLVGRTMQQTSPSGDSVDFRYDKNSNLTALLPSGKDWHQFAYSLVDLFSVYQAPVVGSENSTRSYVFNLSRDLQKMTRADGQEVVYGYDESKVRVISVSMGSQQVNFGYQNMDGQITSFLNLENNVTTGLQYISNRPSRWTEYNFSLSNGSFIQSSLVFSTDVYGRLSSLTHTSWQDSTIAYSYDGDDLMLTAGALQMARTSENGFVSGTQLGVVDDSYTYNSYGEISAYQSDVYSYSVQRDVLGRIIQKAETTAEGSASYNYHFDANDRLSRVDKNGTTISQYTFDGNGNRLSMTTNGESSTAVFDHQDRIQRQGSTEYSFNAEGELQQKTQGSNITKYQYGLYGQLRKVDLPTGHVISYDINGMGLKIGKRVDGVFQKFYQWQSGTQLAAEIGPSGEVSRFVYGLQGHSPDYMVKNGINYRFIKDHLGSIRFVVNASDGTTVQKMDYDEWGRVLVDTNPGFQPFGFAGGMYDGDTGLVRFGARDYDPEVGRWTSKDPILFGGGDTNLFGYVANDPVNWVDPDGLKKTFVFQGGNLALYGDNGQQLFSGPAGSGPYGNGALPQGLYSVGGMRDNRTGSYSCSGSSGYSLNLNPQFSTNRTDLRIHPDGGVPGTLGCIGVSCGNGNADALGNILRGIYNQPMTPWIDLEVR